VEQSNRRWIIRDATGRIDGPFSTEKVLYKISRGEFSGEESIAHYPDGRWIPISQDPQFYDKLLEVISNSANHEPVEETHVLEFTKPQESSPRRTPRGTVSRVERETPKAEPEPDVELEKPAEEAKPKKEKRRSKKRRGRSKRRPEDIELVDVRPHVWKELLQRSRWPLLALVGGLSVLMLFLVTGKSHEKRLHLVAPQRGVAQVAPDQLTLRARQGVGSFLRDTLEGYLKAQNDLVYVTERSNKDGAVMQWLCMTYLQLWPYSYQDSSDSKVITQLVQMTSAVDPGGRFSAVCRAVDLITRARFPEAKSLVESVLDSQVNDSNPSAIFFFLKGDLLERAGDHTTAIGYLKEAQLLQPTWMLPMMIEAQAHTNLDQYPDAAKLYTAILKSNPNHIVARIELGLVEYKYFKHDDTGERYLRQALEYDDAPRTTLSRGYFGLAEISLKRGDQKRALSYAQRAYSLNSSNDSAKNLIVNLGGVDVLRSTPVKATQLMIEGDQFFLEGDYHAAQAHYKSAFEDDPSNAVAAMKAAQCLWKLSFSTEAIEWLERARRADPKLIDAYVYLADYQAQRYNFLAASRVLEQAKAVNPSSPEVFRGFALVELRRGNPAGAITFGKRALQLYANDVETLILMAEASLANRDPKMAYNYASQAKDLDVNNRQAQILYARTLAALQGVDVGSDYLLRLVNNYPLVSEYRLALGKMLMADERYQQAEEIFRQITHLEEKSKEAYIELAKVLKAEGEMGEALDLLLKAAVLDPADAEPLYLSGIIYLDLKKPQEASVQFQRVLNINKLYPLVNYQLGRAALQMGNPKAALDFTELEKHANPSLAEAYLLAAEAHSLMSQYTNCSAEYGQALRLRPQPAGIYVKMATCNRKAGQLDTAMNLLNVAASKESGNADIYKESGAIYEVKGDVNKAIEAYQQYFVLDPDAPDRAQIEARISALQHGQRP
jgi:tetratricopeptide (TPR) repeat protein